MPNNDQFAGLDEAVGAVAHQQQQGVAAQVNNNVMSSTVAPDRAAKNKQLASIVGVPVDTVASDPDLIEMQATLKEINAPQLAIDHPHTARFMTDPQNAQMVRDDVPGTVAVEKAVKALPKYPQQFAVGMPDEAPSIRDRIGNWWASVVGGPTPEQQRQAQSAAEANAILVARARNPALVPKPNATQADIDSLNNQAWESSRQAVGGESQVPRIFAERALNAATFGIVSPTVPMKSHSWQASTSAGLGTLAGFVAGPAKVAAAAVGAAPGAGLLTSAVGDSWFTGLATSALHQGVVLGLASGLQETGSAVLDSHSAGEAASRVGHATASGAAVGATFGAAGKLLPDNTLAQWLGRAVGVSAAQDMIDGNNPFDARPLEDKIFSYAMNAFFTAKGGGRSGGNWFTENADVKRAFADASRAKDAQQTGDMLTALGEAATAAKLRDRDPAAFRKFVDDVTEDGHLQDLYIDARELQNALNQSGVDHDQLAGKLPDVAARLQEGLQTNGDVRIPVADYATHFAGGPLDAAILPHLKAAPDAMTYREGQQFFQNQVEGMTDQAKKIAEDKIAQDQHDASAQVVYDHVAEQLAGANRFTEPVNKAYATMVRDFYTTTAGRLGMSPDALLERYPLQVKAESMEGTKTLDQPERLQRETRQGKWMRDTTQRWQLPFEKLQRMASEGKVTPGDRAALKAIANGKEADAVKSLEKLVAEVKKRPAPNAVEQGKRGSLTFGDDITAQPSVITLLEKADLSTFLHETGHFFLEVTHDIARRPDAPADIKADMQSTLDWFGVKDADTWGSMSLEEKRDSHEKFARGFEAYLMEGKAPSVELQGLFSRFRSWLMNVYHSLASLNVNLTPEVRGVFDRMLASEDAIKAAEQVRNYETLFKTADEAGMSDEQFAEYQALGKSATEDAVADMTARSLKDMKWLSNAKSKALKGLQKSADAERAKIREEVTAEVMAEPVNRARELLKTGKETDDQGNPVADTRPLGAPDIKLDKGDLKEMYPEGALGAPDLSKLRGMTAVDGLHPDLIAERFGINSGHELIRQLVEGEKPKDKIDGLTDQRMLERHGELIDPASIEQAANAAVHNEARSRFMATGLKVLSKSPIPARQIEKAAKAAADAAIAAKKIAELRPAGYSAAEARANKEAIKKAPTDPLGAVGAQRAALLNNRLFRSATDAVADVKKIKDFLGRFDKTSVRAKIDIDIRDQIDDLLARFDLRQKVPEGPTRAEVNLETWIKSQRDAGYQPAFTADMVDPTFRTHFLDMTVEQFRGLRDTVAALEHIGKERRTILVDGARMDVDDIIQNEMIPKMQERGDKFTASELMDRPEDRHTNPVALWFDKFNSQRRAVAAQLKPQEFKRNQYDNHDLLGPFGKFLYDRVFDANYRKVDMLKGISKNYQAKVDELGKDWQKSLNEQVSSTLIDPDKSAEAGEPVTMRFTRGRMIGVAIHVGNESNFDKITRGWGWKPEDVWSFLHDNMTDKDWKAVQAVWDQYETHFPEMVAMAHRLGNTSPDKIEPRPFNTKFGEMRGGYAAIKYDSLRSRRGEKEQAGLAINPSGQLFNRDFFRADTTTNGTMNARVDGYTDRVDLDFHHIARVLSDTIHDLAYREALIDSNKIIENGDFRRQFKRTYGPEAYRSLQDWIGQIANSENFDRQAGALGQFLAYTRTGIVMTGISLRVSTVLKHGGSAGIKTTGYFLGGGEKYLASRFASMATDYRNQISGAQEKFGEIRARLLQQDRDFRVTSTALFEKDPALAKAERFGHAAVAWSDMMTAVPTAWAAYDRAITEGIPKNQGGTGEPVTEAQAVSYANKIVREAHGSNIETARSMVLNTNSEALKMFTTLYGFMNTTYGQALDGYDKLHTAGISNPAVFARSFMALIVPAIWAGYLTHGGAKDGENWATWAGKAIATEVAGMVPFVRDAASMIEGYSHAGQVGVESWLNTLVVAGKDILHLAQGKEVKAPIKNISNAIGVGLHIPGMGQIGTTAQYLSDVQQGKEHPQDALDVARGVAFGPPKKH